MDFEDFLDECEMLPIQYNSSSREKVLDYIDFFLEKLQHGKCLYTFDSQQNIIDRKIKEYTELKQEVLLSVV